MKRLVQIFLALSFATLQCVAPLAHAHVSGGSVDQGIHLPEVQQPYALGELSCCAETNDSPSVGVAQGFERDEKPASPGGSLAYALRLPRAAVATPALAVPTRPDALIFPTPPYRTPYAQAPPAWSNL